MENQSVEQFVVESQKIVQLDTEDNKKEEQTQNLDDLKQIIIYNLSEIDENEAWNRALKILPLLAWRKNMFDVFWRKDDDLDKHYMTMDTKYMYPPKNETTCICFGLTGSEDIYACIKKENNYISIYIK